MDSYKSIIKSTSVVTLVHIFKIFFVFVQNKILAIVVGTSGYGIYGLFYTFSRLVSSFSTLGIDQAGIRQIAKNCDNENFGKSLWTLKFLLFFFSLISFIVIFFLRNKISFSLFGNYDYSYGIVIVGASVFFNGISQGFISILNGVQKLRYIAYSQIFGIASSTIFALIFIYVFGLKGIPFFILTSSLVVFLFSSFYVNKLKLSSSRPSVFFFKDETKTLLSVGAGLAYSAIIVFISSYFSQIYIRKTFGLEWVGMFNASNIVSNVYLGVILTAMGVDLMPKLAKVVDNDIETSKLVNYQMELGLLFSTVGIIIVIAFSPQFLTLIYSSKFTSATSIIKWHIMAAALKVISYPLSYILIVRKKIIKYIIVQTVLWGGSYLLLITLTQIFGVQSLGADFFIAFVIYIIVMYLFNKKSYKISNLCVKMFIISWGFIILTVLLNTIFILPSVPKFIFNIIILVSVIFWTSHYLKKYFEVNVFHIIKNKLK